MEMDVFSDEAPGDARYYLAAVNYQGQRRAGRSAIGGVPGPELGGAAVRRAR